MTAKIFTGSAVQEIDRLAISKHGYNGYELMTRAGERAFCHIDKMVIDARTIARTMLVLCGSGNNGGDGYIVASMARESGWAVSVLATTDPKTESAMAARARFQQAGGSIIDASQCQPSDFAVSVVVDALLGVGLSSAPRPPAAQLIELANQSSALKVALDVPSGVDADTGQVMRPCFKAHETVTFIALKTGLMTGAARSFVGLLSLETLDLAEGIISAVAHSATRLDKPVISLRENDVHKGSFGTVLVIGADRGMLGAGLLAGGAALRSGAGKVRLASVPEHVDRPALWMPELMSEVITGETVASLSNYDAIAFGPGLGQSAWAKSLFAALVKLTTPLVLDADALNLLAQDPHAAPNGNWVLTPHPAEAARLLGCTTAQVQADRAAAATKLAEQYGAVVVLKGAGTLIVDTDGTMNICDIGNPGMATAGMGDVLTGLIGALLAQGQAGFAAARNAVWLHARAADIQVSEIGEAGLLASDVINGLSAAMREAQAT